MKKLLLTVLLGSFLFAGCARRYIVTLANGTQMSVIGKPKMEEGSYVCKDVLGQTVRIPRGSVREIAPASMASSRVNSGYNTAPSK